MRIDREDASIQLSEIEGNVLLGKVKTTPAMLADKNHPSGGYATFFDKVKHRAEELHYETGRTVLIYMEGTDEEIGVNKGDGLVIY